MEELKAVEERYDSPYSGDQETAILQHAEKLKEQTTAEDGDTVQVYDVDGNPHKVAKSELLKKSTLALPNLSDISKFVAVNAKGDAVGLMTKEQVAQVLGELIMVQGRLPNETDWDTLTKTGMYYVSGYNTSYVNSPTGAYLYGILLVFNPVTFGVMQVYSPDNEDFPYIYVRVKNNGWNNWVKFTGMAI